MVDWSDDRIAALSDQDLKNLLANAERKSVAGLVQQCKAEKEKRDAAKPRKLEHEPMRINAGTPITDADQAD